MYNNFYNNNMLPEKRQAWRSASEIQLAAFEHEKRRFQWLHEYDMLAEPQTAGSRPTGWQALFRTPLRLLAILLG